MKWDGLKNGRLLAAVAAEGFDALIMLDDNIPAQQNLDTLPIAVVILKAPSNTMDDVGPLVGPLLDALFGLSPKTIVRVA